MGNAWHVPVRLPIRCSECSSRELRWSASLDASTPHGQIRLHDVTVYASLGCESCGATLHVVNLDTFMHAAPAEMLVGVLLAQEREDER
jgi:hypothetical protein